MPRNLEGMRFGLLKVVERTKQREDGFYVWRCECKCGGEALVSTKRLLRGTVTDCGCVAKTTAKNGPIAEDLTGRHFGEWEVKYRTRNRNDRVMWLCQCSCGTKREISAHALKAGRTSSCKNPIHQHLYNRKDLTNQQFGRLTALYPTEQRDPKGNVYWHCRCECGNFVDVKEDALVQKSCKSCGCLRDEYQKNIPNTLHRLDGTCVEILEKRKSRRDNTSGFRGIIKKRNGKFAAGIGFKRRHFYIGAYESFEEAVNARLEAEHLIHDGFLAAYYVWSQKALAEPAWGESHPLIYDVEKIGGQFKVFTNINELEQEIESVPQEQYLKIF